MSKKLTEQLINEFNIFKSKLNGEKSTEMYEARKIAFDKFIKAGFPTQKDEDWRFTNLGFLNRYNFKLNFEPDESRVSHREVEKFLFDKIRENVVVFVNGYFSKSLSRIVSNGGRIEIGSLAEAYKAGDDDAVLYFNQCLSNPDDIFTCLNTAFSQDGAFIRIADGAVLEDPIHLLYINETKSAPVMTMPRNLIIAGENSQAKVVQTVQTVGSEPSFTNMVTEVRGFQSCNIDFSKVQHDHGKSYYIGTTQVNLYKDAVFHNATFTFNGDFVRNNLHVVMNEEGADTNLHGFYFMKGRDFVDNHTLIDHASPHCTSDELYKGILDEKSHAVFNGKILVRKDAQKTRSYQTNRNILMTDDAKVNTKPELVIYADDVKCSHGATSGNLNKESMFYLKTRGIDEDVAQAMLLNAFAGDVVDKINIGQLRDHAKTKIAERLKMDDVYFCHYIPIKEDQ
jgi:Fe-S cluster assembly protein SufD